MTLTEFLLARIAEDEAEARQRHIFRAQDARMLAECEAKRHIVNLWETTRKSAMLAGPSGGDESVIEDDALTEGLRHLAAVYANHPDFDEAWRL